MLKLNRKFIIIISLILFLNLILVIFYNNSRAWIKINSIPNVYETREGVYLIKYVGNRNITSFSTVVTCLFRTARSKHSNLAYSKWSHTLIKSLSSPLIAFVDVTWADFFIEKLTAANLTGKFSI